MLRRALLQLPFRGDTTRPGHADGRCTDETYAGLLLSRAVQAGAFEEALEHLVEGWRGAQQIRHLPRVRLPHPDLFDECMDTVDCESHDRQNTFIHLPTFETSGTAKTRTMSATRLFTIVEGE
jgi:hypothetical protein